MATTTVQRMAIDVPMRDMDFFEKLANQFRWTTIPLTDKPKSKQMTEAELYALADKIKSSTNKNVPKMSMAEIVQEVRDYRNGK